MFIIEGKHKVLLIVEMQVLCTNVSSQVTEVQHIRTFVILISHIYLSRTTTGDLNKQEQECFIVDFKNGMLARVQVQC